MREGNDSTVRHSSTDNAKKTYRRAITRWRKRRQNGRMEQEGGEE